MKLMNLSLKRDRDVIMPRPYSIQISLKRHGLGTITSDLALYTRDSTPEDFHY